MDKTFTPAVLIRYIYGDVTPSESRALRKALNECHNLREEYELLLEAKSMLGNTKISPGNRSINHILNYSKALHVQKQTDGKSIEMILN